MWSSFDILYISQLIFVSILQSSKLSCCWYKINRCVFLCCFIMYSICVIHANIFFFIFQIVGYFMLIQNHACINYDKIKLTSKIYSKTSNHAVLELIVLEQLSLNLLFSCPCKKNRRKLTEIIRNVLDCMVLEMSTLCCCLYTCILLLFVFFFCSPHMYIIALK